MSPAVQSAQGFPLAASLIWKQPELLENMNDHAGAKNKCMHVNKERGLQVG